MKIKIYKMKKSVSVILMVLASTVSWSQNTWTVKAGFAGGSREGASGFSIGTKGYIVTGSDGNGVLHNDLWEWNQATNTWSQKASFSGPGRYGSVAFSIGTKGYMGTGWASNYLNDFYEWDQASNTWTQKANFGGTPREYAVGFSIGSKGYIGTGYDNNNDTDDFWEFDPASNTWTAKAAFGGGTRSGAAGFSIGTKGYIGTGTGSMGGSTFYEYDQASNTWTQKASISTVLYRENAVGFSIGTKGYITTGIYSGTSLADLREWDQATNVWTQKAPLTFGNRDHAVGFSIGNKGYVGTGHDNSSGFSLSGFYQYSDTAAVGIFENTPPLFNSVYPNPSSTGKFIINPELTKGEISICDSRGQQVFHIMAEGINNSTIDLSDFKKGIYFLSLKKDNQSFSQKLVIY